MASQDRKKDEEEKRTVKLIKKDPKLNMSLKFRHEIVHIISETKARRHQTLV